MPDLNGLYINEDRYDILGKRAEKEGKTRVQFVKELIEDWIDKPQNTDVATREGL